MIQRERPSQIKTIQVILIDDSAIARMGLSTLMDAQPDIQVIGEAGGGEEGIALAKEKQPDVVVVDMKMPGLTGVEVTRALCESLRAVRVLVLTSYEGEENIFQALKAGALGYVTKDMAPTEILTAIRTIHEGRRYVPAAIAEQLAERMLHPELSPREQQTLQLMAQGMTNKAIGATLKISPKTAKMFVASVLSKMGVASRTEAVSVAIKRGLIDPP